MKGRNTLWTEENVQNCQREQSVLPRVSAIVSTLPSSSLPGWSALSYFSPVFSTSALRLLSAVSKIDWGPLCLLLHVGSFTTMFSLSICLRCQGVSWVPACLLLNIYHLLNTVAAPHSHTPETWTPLNPPRLLLLHFSSPFSTPSSVFIVVVSYFPSLSLVIVKAFLLYSYPLFVSRLVSVSFLSFFLNLTYRFMMSSKG